MDVHRGPLCVYIRPYGAKTTRPSGGDALFFEHEESRPRYAEGRADDAQASIKARKVFVGADRLSASRMSAFELRCWSVDVIEKFRNGEDPYINVASKFYGYAVNKKIILRSGKSVR